MKLPRRIEARSCAQLKLWRMEFRKSESRFPDEGPRDQGARLNSGRLVYPGIGTTDGVGRVVVRLGEAEGTQREP